MLSRRASLFTLLFWLFACSSKPSAVPAGTGASHASGMQTSGELPVGEAAATTGAGTATGGGAAQVPNDDAAGGRAHAGDNPAATGGSAGSSNRDSGASGVQSPPGVSGTGAGTPAAGGTGSMQTAELTAFPGAQGFGRLAVGARGGDVVHVTNLNDSGAGSLRDAISQPNRTVVFDVAGVIRISSRLIFKNNQTIAGQTAPGGGITIYGDGTSFSGASNTIVRYLRFRMGMIGESGKDSVTMANGHDVIWDHCSMSWGRDGTFDLNQESGSTLTNLTLQDSIVSQGLQTHSTGGLVVTGGTSIIRTLYIDNNSRNPKARGTTQFINNLVYDWVVSGYILGDTSGRSDGYLAGNYFIPGPETHGGTLDSPTPDYHVYATDNYYDDNKNGMLDGRALEQGDFGTATWEAMPSVMFPSVPVLSAAEAFQQVRDHAGASLWRDAVDDYVMSELTSLGRSGATISDESSLGLAGAVGDVPGGTAPEDSDQDGMPDAWERANGLRSDDASDRNGDRNGDGWTNLEEYINSLAR